MPIAEFEGILEPLGRMAGNSYMISSSVSTTAMAIGAGEKPSVISAILKYHSTELARNIGRDAMDIHGGKAVMLGPKNYLAGGYESTPVGITVEGANIMTRSLIIFGQGAFRCHPYVLKEIEAVNIEDKNESLEQFDLHLFGHIGHSISCAIRALVRGITDRFTSSPVEDETATYYKQINRLSAGFAFLTDISMLVMGGELKRKETISARLGDVLSSLYLASTTLKHYEDTGERDVDLPLLEWTQKTLLFESQEKLSQTLDNFPNKAIASFVRFIIFPKGRNLKAPSIKETLKLGKLVSRNTKTREKLIHGIYQADEPSNHFAQMNKLLDLYESSYKDRANILRAKKKGLISGSDFQDLLANAAKEGIINEEKIEELKEYNDLADDIINVDDFSQEEVDELR